MHNQRVKFNLYVRDEFTIADSVATQATICADQDPNTRRVTIDLSPAQASWMIRDLAILLAGVVKP